MNMIWRALRSGMPLLVLGVLLSSFGCAQNHTIEPGIWQMNFDLRTADDSSKFFLRKEPRKVEVQVDWGKEKDAEGRQRNTELIKVQYEIQVGSRTDYQVLKGRLRGDRSVELEGYDRDWLYWLVGKVENPRLMKGVVAVKARRGETSYEYAWILEKAVPAE